MSGQPAMIEGTRIQCALKPAARLLAIRVGRGNSRNQLSHRLANLPLSSSRYRLSAAWTRSLIWQWRFHQGDRFRWRLGYHPPPSASPKPLLGIYIPPSSTTASSRFPFWPSKLTIQPGSPTTPTPVSNLFMPMPMTLRMLQQDSRNWHHLGQLGSSWRNP